MWKNVPAGSASTSSTSHAGWKSRPSSLNDDPHVAPCYGPACAARSARVRTHQQPPPPPPPPPPENPPPREPARARARRGRGDRAAGRDREARPSNRRTARSTNGRRRDVPASCRARCPSASNALAHLSVQPNTIANGRNRVNTFSCSAHRDMWVSAVSITVRKPAHAPQHRGALGGARRHAPRRWPAAARARQDQRDAEQAPVGERGEHERERRRERSAPATPERVPLRAHLVGTLAEPPPLHGVGVERLLHPLSRAANDVLAAPRS